MTKQDFCTRINQGLYPKYVLSQINEGTPKKDCSALVCTESGGLMLAKYEHGKWQQAHFTTTEYGVKQRVYYTDIKEGILYWTDEEPKDRSRKQFE